MNQVQIIADSISPQGHRITTFVCTFWRALLAEVNTHRMLSRNSASSRAIPFKKMVEKVQNDPFIPMKWMKEHTGMQGTEYITDERTIDHRLRQWLDARNKACSSAWALASELPFPHEYDQPDAISKQIANRLLEPFLHHTALITGTEFENFFALRAHPQAEIHFADLAQKMLDAYNESEPKKLKAGEWHTPFGDQIEGQRLFDTLNGTDYFEEFYHNPQSFELKIATARCARISYGTFEGKDDYEADIKLHDRLLASGHLSPFEHCAMAQDELSFNSGEYNTGNFIGWIQYRKLFPNENLKDPRVKHYDVK